MRYSLFCYLLLAGTLLTWSACDDDTIIIDPPTECFEELPFLALSDGDCSPTVYRFTDLNDFPDNAGLELPPECPSANDHGQILQVEVPASGVLDVHVYNGTYGYANVTVYSANACDQDIAAINGCFSTTDVASKFTVDGLNGFENAYVRIDISASGPGEPFAEYNADADEFIGIAVWEEEPQIVTRVSYRGYEEESQLETLSVSCDGSGTQRVILGSCNPNADIQQWREDAGLNRSEGYSGDGGTLEAADVPPGLDPNTTVDALAKRRPRQNTGDYYTESDFIIRVPVPNSPGLFDANDFNPQQPGELFNDCLSFDLGTGSTDNPDDQIVVTMIDSGVDNVDAENRGYWNNHLNRSVDKRYTPVNSLGYDFVFGGANPSDDMGHGTNTAGALIGDYDGQFPLTVIHNKIFSIDEVLGVYGTYFGAVVATNVAVDAGSDIINASWGASPDNEPQALRCAVAYAENNGTIIVTSSGNDGVNIEMTPQWPAAFSADFTNVVTVGSWMYPDGIGSDPSRPDFSNFGPTLVSVSAYLTARTPRYSSFGDLPGGFNFLVGTSISTPLVSGVLAEEFNPFNGTFPGFQGRFNMSGSLMSAYEGGNYLPVCPDLLGTSD